MRIIGFQVIVNRLSINIELHNNTRLRALYTYFKKILSFGVNCSCSSLIKPFLTETNFSHNKLENMRKIRKKMKDKSKEFHSHRKTNYMNRWRWKGELIHVLQTIVGLSHVLSIIIMPSKNRKVSLTFCSILSIEKSHTLKLTHSRGPLKYHTR